MSFACRPCLVMYLSSNLLPHSRMQVLAGPDTGAFIVLFKTPQAATLAANSSVYPPSSSSLEAFKVQPAPSPEDINWPVSGWAGQAVRP